MKIKKKSKKQIYRKPKRNKGITLIALVVTIIVLLLLAGVSVQMIAGEGGILGQARDAGIETRKATAKERIELEIAQTLLEDSEFSAERLNKNLEAHIPELTHGGQSLTENPIEEFPTIVELDGYVFQIDEYGKVTAIDGITLSRSNLELQILTHEGEKTEGEETLTATLVGISGNIIWSTEEKEIIDIEPTDEGTSAKITAKKQGTEKVTATCSGRTAECNVTVKEVTAVTSITLDPTEKTINEGEELEITAQVDGTEDLQWDVKDSTGDTKLTITPSGDGKKKCTVVAQGAGTATVVANAKYATEATCKITVKSPYIDNSYVQYDVGYIDTCTKTEYTKNTGWRAITDLTSYEVEGTYKGNIEIISTGLPAELYYDSSTVENAPWAGTMEQRKKFVNEYFGSVNSKNIYASAGLLYNFEKIVFDYKGENLNTSTITQNNGGFICIWTNGNLVEASKEITGKSLFTANIASGTIDEIRTVNQKELTGRNDKSGTTIIDSKKGLFHLENYRPDTHDWREYRYWIPVPNDNSVYTQEILGHVRRNRG